MDGRQFLPTGPPSAEQVERAMEVARAQGFLTDDGFIWERDAPWRSRLRWKALNVRAWVRLRFR
jgi:hypothetical protein